MENKKGLKIAFQTAAHAENYKKLLSKSKLINCETKAVMYLLSLACRNIRHAEDCFDFDESHILIKGLNASWQTGTSVRAIKLAFNLWNGHDINSSVYSLFGTRLDEYFIEAIKIRFEI